MSERWLPVPNYTGRYEVSDRGRVRSTKRRDALGRLVGGKQIRAASRDGRGYLAVHLWDGAKQRLAYVHAIVLEAFVGPRPPGMQACHFPDPTPKNCRLENLRWDTRCGNRADQRKHGTELTGDRHPNSKLTPRIVRAIRERAANGELQAVLAKEVGVSKQQISKIVRHEEWRHV